MNHKNVIAIVLLASLVTACGPKQSQTETRSAAVENTEAQPRRTPEFRLRDSLQVGSHKWVYNILRQPDDSLEIVTDEDGQRYVDNFYQLDITRDGHDFFSKRLTKATLQSRLSAQFRQYGILDGLRFNRYEDGKLYFSICVSYPESDEYAPFLLIIGPDGSHVFENDELLDLGDIELSDEMKHQLEQLKERETEE